jgi:hypothetical protein
VPALTIFSTQDGVNSQSSQPESFTESEAAPPWHTSGPLVRSHTGHSPQLAGRSRLVPPQSSGCSARLLSRRSRSGARPARDHCSQEVAGGMDVGFVSADGIIQQHPVKELERLLARDDGIVWVDIPVCDEEACGVRKGVHAARRYSWSRPPSRSRRNTRPRHRSPTLAGPAAGSGASSRSARCGRCRL